MIYIFRTLWIIAFVVVFLIECIAFVLGCVTYPFAFAIHYIRNGYNASEMKYSAGTIACYIEKQFHRLGEHIEKMNKTNSKN